MVQDTCQGQETHREITHQTTPKAPYPMGLSGTAVDRLTADEEENKGWAAARIA